MPHVQQWFMKKKVRTNKMSTYGAPYFKVQGAEVLRWLIDNVWHTMWQNLVPVSPLSGVIHSVLVCVQFLLQPRYKDPLKDYPKLILQAMIRLEVRWMNEDTYIWRVLLLSYQPDMTPWSSSDSNPSVNQHRICDHVILGITFFLFLIQRCCKVPCSAGSCHWRSIVCALAMPKFSDPGSLWVTMGISSSR